MPSSSAHPAWKDTPTTNSGNDSNPAYCIGERNMRVCVRCVIRHAAWALGTPNLISSLRLRLRSGYTYTQHPIYGTRTYNTSYTPGNIGSKKNKFSKTIVAALPHMQRSWERANLLARKLSYLHARVHVHACNNVPAKSINRGRLINEQQQ